MFEGFAIAALVLAVIAAAAIEWKNRGDSE
jgi:hypothetical protein